MPVDRDHKGRIFVRDSEAQAKYDAKTVRPAEAGGLGAAAKANASKPKLPKRTDFTDDASYSKAYKGYMDSRNSDPDAMAQKKALERMGK